MGGNLKNHHAHGTRGNDAFGEFKEEEGSSLVDGRTQYDSLHTLLEDRGRAGKGSSIRAEDLE